MLGLTPRGVIAVRPHGYRKQSLAVVVNLAASARDGLSPGAAAADPAYGCTQQQGQRPMTKEELTAWATTNGWVMIAGMPSLTKPSSPKEAIVRMVLKATVVHIEVKKPAGKWEKFTGESYAKVTEDTETGVPLGLGLDTIPGFRMLMQENRDRAVFARMTGKA